MARKLVLALVVTAGFVLADQGNRWFDLAVPDDTLVFLVLAAAERLLWYLLVPLLLLWVLHGRKSVLSETGLNRDARKPLFLAIVATSPTFLGYGWAADFTLSLDTRSLVLGVVVAAVVEELYFRGFLFGQFYRRVGIPFLPAAAVSAFIFAVGHWHQSDEWLEMAGIFAVTFIGGVWFGWLWIRSSYNLWLPIFMHGLLNLSWSLFAVDDNALGGVEANIYRLLAIALSIGLTIYFYPHQRTNGG